MACGHSPDAEPASGTALSAAAALWMTPQAAEAAEKPGKETLVVATMWECLPFSMQARRSRFFNESEILDTLIKLDYEMNLIPGLATAWNRTGDTEWVFTLREQETSARMPQVMEPTVPDAGFL